MLWLFVSAFFLVQCFSHFAIRRLSMFFGFSNEDYDFVMFFPQHISHTTLFDENPKMSCKRIEY